jgi:predicted metal-dependent HD superfamily phosphohydrolase
MINHAVSLQSELERFYPGITCQSIIENILHLYDSPHRYYHNRIHLNEMTVILFHYGSNTPDYPLLLLAALYHDAVYQPGKPDNELKSSELWIHDSPVFSLSQENIQLITRLIAATQHHQSDSLPSDALLFPDADLAILGSDVNRYRNYAQAIRKEFCQIPDDQYRVGRSAVLESFLKQKTIYKTPVMIGEFEENARSNILKEIERLKNRTLDSQL